MWMITDVESKQTSVLLHSGNIHSWVCWLCYNLNNTQMNSHEKPELYSVLKVWVSQTWIKLSLTLKTCQWRSLLNVSFCQGLGLIRVWETSWVSQNCNHCKLLNHCSVMSQGIFCFYWCHVGSIVFKRRKQYKRRREVKEWMDRKGKKRVKLQKSIEHFCNI